MAYIKKRTHTVRETRMVLRGNLQYIQRDIGYIEKMVAHGVSLSLLGNDLYRKLLCVYGKRKKRAKRLNGGDVHFVKITVKITPPPWLALPLIEQKYHFVQLLSVRLKTASTYFDKVSFPF